MSKQHIYADGAESISMLDGMVRLDLYCSEGRDAQGKVQREVTTRLVLPPPAFLRMYEAMGRVVARMERDGLIARKPAQAPASTVPAAEQNSPNFE